MAQPNSATFTVAAQTISVLVSGQPDVKNRFGPGHIRPDGVRLSYRGQHIDARVDGRWVRETGELMDERLDQHYTVRAATDIVEWPDWLCALATLLRPAAVSAPVQPAERADDELRDRIAALFRSAPGEERLGDATPGEIADAVLAAAQEAARSNLLREAAEAVQSGDVQFDTKAIEAALKNAGPFALITYVQHATGEHLRRMAGEEQPATETRCSHGCDVSVCPCLACESEEEEPEKTVREHVTTLHLIGEQLAQVESWMWSHLADVRQARRDGDGE